MWLGMIPTLQAPGVITPGEFGPMIVVERPATRAVGEQAAPVVWHAEAQRVASPVALGHGELLAIDHAMGEQDRNGRGR